MIWQRRDAFGDGRRRRLTGMIKAANKSNKLADPARSQMHSWQKDCLSDNLRETRARVQQRMRNDDVVV